MLCCPTAPKVQGVAVPRHRRNSQANELLIGTQLWLSGKWLMRCFLFLFLPSVDINCCIEVIGMVLIFTNNPMVADRFPETSRFLETDVSGVFASIRDEVHKGAALLTHPLSGSVKPNESPYKSVILSMKTGGLDFKSLNLIENAIDMMNRLQKLRHCYSESVLTDFKVIDLELVNSAFMGEQVR